MIFHGGLIPQTCECVCVCLCVWGRDRERERQGSWSRSQNFFLWYDSTEGSCMWFCQILFGNSLNQIHDLDICGHHPSSKPMWKPWQHKFSCGDFVQFLCCKPRLRLEIFLSYILLMAAGNSVYTSRASSQGLPGHVAGYLMLLLLYTWSAFSPLILSPIKAKGTSFIGCFLVLGIMTWAVRLHYFHSSSTKLEKIKKNYLEFLYAFLLQIYFGFLYCWNEVWVTCLSIRYHIVFS